jgi:hypothetical protein
MGCALADDDGIGGWAGAAVDFQHATCERVLQRRSRRVKDEALARRVLCVVVIAAEGSAARSRRGGLRRCGVQIQCQVRRQERALRG